MGEKKKNGKIGALHAKSLFIGQKFLCYNVYNWIIYPPRQAKLPKSTKVINYYKDKMGRNQKRNRKAKLQTGSRNSV